MTDLILDLEIKILFNVTENVTLFVYVDTLNVSPKSYYNNTVKVTLIKTKTALAFVTPIVKSLVNKKLGDGVAIGGFLQAHGLGILDLSSMIVTDHEGYLLVQVTPEYRRQPVSYWLPQSVKDLLVGKAVDALSE